MASVHDVAAYILSKRPGGMSTMKLQKLCYYSQGWALAWDEQPLFAEPIRAWANGPVVYELFDKHRGQFRVRQWPYGGASNLKDFEKETIDAVLNSYGGLTGQQLSDKTHSEPPWMLARRGTQEGALSTAEISLQAMQEYFGALAHKEAVALEQDDAVEEEAEELLEDDEGDEFYDYEPPDDYYASAEYADLGPAEEEYADYEPSDVWDR